jgi:hypothetical protein
MVLAAILLSRTILPAGFMPDFAAWGEGRFQLVICAGHGSKTITVDGALTPVPFRASDAGSADEACAFALAAAFAVFVFTIALGGLPTGLRRAFAPSSSKHTIAAARCGGVGSRAPPSA